MNDYAGVQNNLKSHAKPEYGDESIQDQIKEFAKVTGRNLLEQKTTAVQLKEKVAEGNQLNLNTMLAALMWVSTIWVLAEFQAP